MMFDTDVLIWIFRGNKKAAKALEAARERDLSIVSYMELLQGARNRQEVKFIRRFLTDFEFSILPLTEEVGHRASIYMEEYGLGEGMCMADALIAATAVENRLTLCTGDRKHYRPIRDLETKIFRP